jgi:O-antigen ligase
MGQRHYASTVRHVRGVKAEDTDPSDPLSRAGYALVLLAVPLVTFNALRPSENMTYGDIPLAIGAVLLLALWLRHGHPRGVVPLGLVVGASLLLATGLLSSMPAEDASLAPALRFSVTLGFMPLILMYAASTPRRVQQLVDAWLLAAGLNAAVGALDILGVTDIGTSLTSVDFVTYTDRATGLTGHPNHLGLVAAMALPVAISRLGAGGLRGLAAFGLVPLLIIGVVESGSRAATLAAVAGVAIFFLLGVSTRRTRTPLLLIAASLVTFVTLIAIVGHNELTGSVTVERLGGGAGAPQSNEARILALRESITQALDNPLVGDGYSVVRTANNIYLQVFQAGGILALAGFLTFAVSIVRRARWLALPSHGSPPWLTGLAAGSGASACVWLVYGMVGNAVYDRYLYVPVGVALAVGLVHRRFFGMSQPPKPPPTAGGIALGVVASDGTATAPLDNRLAVR